MKIQDQSNQFVKAYGHWSRNAFSLIAICLFLSGYDANQAIGSDTESGRAASAAPASLRPVNGAGCLVVHRIADLGNDVIVDLYVDGMPMASIGYGHTYEGCLPPGRYVLSVLPTPDPRWPTPWQMSLDVRKGQTYSFTAMGDHSGHLILKEAELAPSSAR
jgi:hypothetical protein